MGSLNVKDSGGVTRWTKTGDQGNSWQQAIVDLVTAGEFTFEAVRGNGYMSDIALDDVYVVCSVFKPPDFASLRVALDFWDGSPTNGQLAYSAVATWDVTAVTDFTQLLNGNGMNEPVSGWDASAVSNMDSMFYNADGSAADRNPRAPSPKASAPPSYGRIQQTALLRHGQRDINVSNVGKHVELQSGGHSRYEQRQKHGLLPHKL
jgi:hypothetical protein